MMTTKKEIFACGGRPAISFGRFGPYSETGRIFRQIPPNPQRGFHFIAAILVVAMTCFAACGNGNGISDKNAAALDLMDKLSPIAPIGQDEHFEPNQFVIRKGIRRKAIVIVAPARIHASLQGISGKATLKGWATPVYNIGDGLQMDLFLARNGARRRIGDRYFDSGRIAEDRDWIPVEFPLEIGKGDWLEIEISGGPEGDLVADWLALNSLELFKKR